MFRTLRLLFLSIVAMSTYVVWPTTVDTHGSFSIPPSRAYYCRFVDNPENPSNGACLAAKNLNGTNQFYNWNGINQLNANGNHQSVVPNGQLCGGGKDGFRGLNLARNDWFATPIRNGADGTFEFVFNATAPHITENWTFYYTRNGYSHTSPLTWGDLVQFCQHGDVPLSTGSVYRMRCRLPAVTGKRTIFTVWQRKLSQSTEAFYTCTDVVLGGTTSQFSDAGSLTAQNALPAGTVVSLRVFDGEGNDVERIDHVVAEGQGGAADWPFFFAQTVNERSTRARIGVQSPSGDTKPVRAAVGNRVFTATGEKLNHAIDIDSDGSRP